MHLKSEYWHNEDKAIKRPFDYLFICNLTIFFMRFYDFPKVKSFKEGFTLFNIVLFMKNNRNTILFEIDVNPMIGFQYVKKEGESLKPVTTFGCVWGCLQPKMHAFP